MHIRTFEERDADAVWRVIEPPIRAGDVFAFPTDWSRTDALGYWLSPGHDVFVAEADGTVVGTYYLRPNQSGGGDHVANCGYATAADAVGRGIGRAMCAHSLERAVARGFKAMQFNIVVSSNKQAVALWQDFGFKTVGTLPSAFRHPTLGYVDALVMHRPL